jgi:dephospho-CoA kinase
MGQAKARGTLEQRVAQAEQRIEALGKRREMDERALARMDAANKRQATRQRGDEVVLATRTSRERLRRSSPHYLAKVAMLVGLVAALKEPGR